jgi:cytochrome c peroxidase
MSKDGSISCASCHRQADAFTDTARFSEGVRGLLGGRQAMAVFNMAWNENEFFWDGRAHLLRNQSLKPVQDTLEMDETVTNVIAKLKNDQQYKDQFIRAFDSDEITEEKMELALEQFMNSIVSVDSKYDRYLNGTATLDSSEERGRLLFFAEYNPSFPSLSGADCQHCHSGRNFENDKYLNNALDTDAEMADDGRMEVTGNSSDRGKFKVTSLRNIELTAPYMHDGRFNTLEEVVDHYNTGMKNSSTVDPALIYPLNNNGLQLTAEDKRDLVAFLKTLTDEVMITNPEYSDPF